VPSTVTYLSQRYPSKTILVTCCFVPATMVAASNVVYIALVGQEPVRCVARACGSFERRVVVVDPGDDAKVRAMMDAKARLEPVQRHRREPAV